MREAGISRRRHSMSKGTEVSNNMYVHAQERTHKLKSLRQRMARDDTEKVGRSHVMESHAWPWE